MRTLHADLTAAQKQPSRVPYVKVTAENVIETVRRLDWTTLNSVSNATTKHDICVAGDGSISTIRFNAADVTHYLNRVTDPAVAANWDAWTALPPINSANAAIAADGARVAYAYTTGTSIYVRESTDYGATFGAAVNPAVGAATVQDLALAYKPGGDLALFWVTATNLYAIRRTAGTWGAVKTHGTTYSSLTGIAAVKVFDWEVIITGKTNTTTLPTVWSAIFGDGVLATLDTWGVTYVQAQGESGLTVFQSPSITYADAWRVTFVEVPAYTGGVTRAYRMYLNPATDFTAGDYGWRTPTPVNYANALGLALAASATHVYERGPTRVQRASYAQSVLTLTDDVLALELRDDQWDGRGWVDIQNSGAAYAGPPSQLQVGNRLNIEFGYYTATGNRSSRGPDWFIEALEYRRKGGVSVLRLHVRSWWWQLRNSRQRTQIVNTLSLRSTITQIVKRVGGLTVHNFTSARVGAIFPKFTIHPTTTGYDALRQAFALIADRIVWKQNGEAWLIEALASDTTDYTLGTDHPVYEHALRTEPVPVSEAQAVSVAASAQVAGWATSYADAEKGMGTQAQVRDVTSTTAGTIQATATAHLRQRQLDQRAGRIVCPPVCGLELLDCVDISDGYVSVSAQLRRVMGITWKFDRTEKATVYEQELALGPV